MINQTHYPAKTYEAIASTAIKTAFHLQSPVIIGVTDRHLLTRYMSKFKPYSQMIVAVTNPKLANQTCLSRSVNGILVKNVDTLPYNSDDIILSLIKCLKAREAV